MNRAASKAPAVLHSLARMASRAGRSVLETALALQACARDPSTPRAARVCIYGALAYLISPFDAIPDFMPVIGFSDDWTTLIAAVATVGLALKPEHRRIALEKTDSWFGPRTPGAKQEAMPAT